MAAGEYVSVSSQSDTERADLARERAELATQPEFEREELAQLRHREIEVRSAETPAFSEIAAAITDRDGLLWTRRPEHRSFLEVRFGEGILPSRTRLKLPPRGETAAEQWKELCEIEGEFAEVSPVPVLERLDCCGSIGVAGEPIWAEGRIVGSITSGMYGHRVEASLGMGYVRGEMANAERLAAGGFEIEIAWERVPASAQLEPFYDPRSLRVRA